MPAWVLSLSRYKNGLGIPLPHEHLVLSPIKLLHLSSHKTKPSTIFPTPPSCRQPITIAQGVELMTNLVSAVAVPASRRFFAFTTAARIHSTWSSMSTASPSSRTWGPYGTSLGMFKLCCLVQDTDMTLSIAVATLVESDKSRFYLIYGVMPADPLTHPSSKVAEGNGLFPTIYDIYMSAFTYKVGTACFPMMLLALQPWDRVTKEDQLATSRFYK
ncbi:hypothetical protein B0T24DRAFT_152734 [Lasiosphaeria ovina]|uniref:Uncharacterized protein n=1 Tax=Lasiosphaeria ovina TaxID=92902 RepID=A0AAE0ND66_9PEZI|nr:hypothetical protein B0T24DRAFT_152734 [Lasiosphaeria ovina]